MVLLIIDTQKALVNSDLYMFETFVRNIRELIKEARKDGTEVIYVIHDDGADGSLTEGTEGFEIFGKFKPLSDEKIFVKRANSAFKDTGLLEYLRSENETEVIVAGLQTDKCINATVISGFEHGLKVIVPAYANSTVDNSYMDREKSYLYFNHFMWKGRYAECISLEETIKRMKERKAERKNSGECR